MILRINFFLKSTFQIVINYDKLFYSISLNTSFNDLIVLSTSSFDITIGGLILITFFLGPSMLSRIFFDSIPSTNNLASLGAGSRDERFLTSSIPVSYTHLTLPTKRIV